MTLEAGDEVKNALLKIAQSLHRVEPSPPPPSTPDTQVRENNPSTDIPNDLNSSKDDVQLPRVQSKERQWTKGAEPYKQTKYNLRPRSYKHRAAKFLLAQHLFCKQKAMHVYNINGRQ